MEERTGCGAWNVAGVDGGLHAVRDWVVGGGISLGFPGLGVTIRPVPRFFLTAR